MHRNRTSLALLLAAVVGVLIVPSMVQARSRTGSDLGTRVAALEAALATHMGSGDHDGRYVRDGGENLRVIRGSLTHSGGIIAGGGFTTSHPSTGVYVISCSAPFGGTPTATATIFTNGGETGTVYMTEELVARVEFQTRDLSGSLADLSIEFVVVGPQ